MLHRFLSLLPVLIAFGCNGPVVLLPGGKLDGETRPVPTDWAFAGDYGTAQLETRPGDPYSVNIVYTIVDGSPFINAGDTETKWVKNIAADSQVRFRLDGVLYDMRAERVENPATIAAFARAWTSQSLFRRNPGGLEALWLYRLVPR
ncbi:MAG: hypothetical protein GY772_27270 [bacterium]|nr:hypothetical protein [bacterium]MDP6074949.1 hypothetical protein [Myxococcota bacterium]MDP6244502.1 hypothetical protein [Myxococcota bacterium]MDP7300824.1 hypothetical protein [Myxococcota bacterium]HJO24752.1 hypothetical protein [Myxococcota bacterium]